MNQLDMGGRCAVITGGAAGIGFAIAKRLAASGARLALWDRDSQALASAASALGGSVTVVEIDVADETEVGRAAASTISTTSTSGAHLQRSFPLPTSCAHRCMATRPAAIAPIASVRSRSPPSWRLDTRWPRL